MGKIKNVRAYNDIIKAITNKDKDFLEKIRTDYKGFDNIKNYARSILSYTAMIQSKIDTKDKMLACFNGNVPNKLDDIQVYKQIMEAFDANDKDSLSKLNINFYDLLMLKGFVEGFLRSVEATEKTLDLNDPFLECYNKYYLQ